MRLADLDTSRKIDFSIPAQDLDAALVEFSKQASLQVVVDGDEVKALKTEGARGRLSISQALTALLKSSGLAYKAIGDSAISIGKFTDLNTAVAPLGSGKEGEANGRLRFAQADGPTASRTQPPVGIADGDAQSRASEDGDGERQSFGLEEIVVTAQKRIERLQEVPVPVAAVDAEALVDRNQLRLEDYYSQVPALSLTTADPFGGAMIAIRGVTTGGYNNPTVGIVVDDVPYNSAIGTGYGYVAVEMDPSELQRIEVLRGPQGTLYGASSLGGLLKYVTIDPSTDRLSGHVQGSVSGVVNGDGAGYGFRGSVNVPLSDTWAIRASGFTRRDPGYIDDPVHAIKGINQVEVSGGRWSALWRPSEAFSVKLSAMLQDSDADGSALMHVLPGFGDLEQSTPPGWGGYHKKLQVYNANLSAKLGRADLVAVSAYIDNKNTDLMDFSAPFAGFVPLTEDTFGTTVEGTTSPALAATDKFTQEFRLSLPLGDKLDWLLGAFYADEDTFGAQKIQAVDFGTGAVVGNWLDIVSRVTLKEYSLFTNLTWQATERFDIQFGGRQSQNKQTYSAVQSGPYNGVFGFPEPNVTPLARSKDHSFTYLVTPRLRVSPNLMVYSRLASGYRPGGPNPGAGASGLPAEYGPDKTQNYEIGIKGNLWQNTLSFDASVYHIIWQDVQIQLFDPQSKQGYFVNGAEAKSQGVELSAEARPLDGMSIAAWVAWNDAVLTESFPEDSTAIGADGDRLPTSSRFSGSFSIEQEFALISGVTGFAGGAISYVGDRQGPFWQSAERQALPSYVKTDLRAGLRYESWAANLFVNNVADKRAVLTGGIGGFYPDYFTVIQPRTIGLSVSRTF